MHILLSLLSYGVTIFANAVLGLVVFFRNPKGKENQLFALLTLSIITWIGTLFLYYTVSTEPWLLWIGRINLAFAVLIPLVTFHFISVFPERLIRISHWVGVAVSVLSGVFFLLTLTPLVDVNELASGIDRTTIFGPLYLLFLIEIVFMCLVCIILLVKKWKKAVGIVRMQLVYFFLGFVSLFIIAIFFNGILPFFFKDYGFQALGSLASIGFVGFTTYAITKHHFMDINRIIAQLLQRLSLYALLGIVYVAVAIGIGTTFFPQFVSIQYILVTIGICLIIRMSVDPFRNNFASFSNSLFGRSLYSREKIIKEVLHITQSIIELKILIKEILRVLVTYMHISEITYISFAGEDVVTCISYPKNEKSTRNRKKSLQPLFGIKEQIITEELAPGAQKKLLMSHKIALVFPLALTKTRNRMLLLGPKTTKYPYFDYDLKTLKNISQPFVIAIQNAKHLQGVKSYNKNLQHEIDRATKELQRVNSQLRHADKRKDEFISIASHELKTPTTAIHGFLWLVLQKDHKLSLYTREKLEKVAKLTEQISTLVNDMLDVSKIESKRISLHPEIFDIVQLVEEIKGELDILAVHKHITIHVTNGKVYPVWADKSRARQIINNLLSNAVKYTPENGKVGIHFRQNEKGVEILVQDTGMGIRHEDMPRLFTKFGKLEDGNSANSHLPGTGLGLYITKNLVELSGGSIGVDSVYGKGATFTFSLPAKEMV